jgi:hypothetical protein
MTSALRGLRWSADMLLIILILLLLFGGGGGYYWGWPGASSGLGTVLVVLLILYLLGYLR